MINSSTEQRKKDNVPIKITIDRERRSSTAGTESTFSLSNNTVLTDEQMKQNYHVQRLNQSRIAFWLSFYGCIVIAIGIVTSIFIKDIAWIEVVSGAIIETVSALFFYLSDKANEKISEFFLELQKDSDKKNARDLAMKITDEKIKNELIVKLALHLSGIDEDRICRNTNEVCKKTESKD